MLKYITALLICLMAVSVAFAQADMLDDTPRIAVISAFEPEIAVFLAEAEIEETYTVNGVEYTTATLGSADVVMFLSGVSTVNAAMNTQIVLDRFNITHIVYSGIAGGVNPDLSIGDVTIPAQWGQYLEMAYARELEDGTFSPPPFYEYEFENFGMMFPRPVTVYTDENPDGETKFWFDVDAEMLDVAAEVAESVELVQCNAEEVCLTEEPMVVVGGTGVSGPVFVDNAEFRDYAFATFEANVLDMETASVAMVAYSNDVPYIAFRSLSDLAGGGPDENEMGTFFSIAADNSALVVIDFLEAWTAET